MSNVLNFPGRQQPAAQPAPQAPTPAVEEMVKQSAVMQLVAALAFYSQQGYDGGEKARAAFPALREVLARSSVELAFPN